MKRYSNRAKKQALSKAPEVFVAEVTEQLAESNVSDCYADEDESENDCRPEQELLDTTS